MFSSALSIFLQLSLLSCAMAEEMVVATGHGDAWQYGTGGGIIGLLVLVFDIFAILEIVKSSRPPLHKVLWSLFVFFFPIVGLVAYYLFSNRPSGSGSGEYEAIV
ncbi:hypothetical protein MBM_05449 [Drepanopeziza brunnea f. sp. 'multigermtubi' MB_m1]|uniref:Cardiolipin synthase N-terminal domain-containing protein n=1 Tax=Marssonina brunnea f. sp. multigermtubi (strain MB_m1) TaxID=1072389 RepID=K1WFG3_MARBU|nr:uncharacterized protein MBM_05449 [Drepanopeziza brunnea f. sp. 'multigermtubi' MB_m1]EKD16155.1 hypothetical protein MBM_05449 [Drepanopeziza brunnea f. sp. 'multigermtubi' MB_m1]